MGAKTASKSVSLEAALNYFVPGPLKSRPTRSGTSSVRSQEFLPGKRVSADLMHFYRLDDGRIMKHWMLLDMMGLIAQCHPLPNTLNAPVTMQTTQSGISYHS
jgi:hypothetical protein